MLQTPKHAGKRFRGNLREPSMGPIFKRCNDRSARTRAHASKGRKQFTLNRLPRGRLREIEDRWQLLAVWHRQMIRNTILPPPTESASNAAFVRAQEGADPPKLSPTVRAMIRTPGTRCKADMRQVSDAHLPPAQAEALQQLTWRRIPWAVGQQLRTPLVSTRQSTRWRVKLQDILQ